jgi:hypothetical protein
VKSQEDIKEEEEEYSEDRSLEDSLDNGQEDTEHEL